MASRAGVVAPLEDTGWPGVGRHGWMMSVSAAEAESTGMTAWIVLTALAAVAALSARALRHGHPKEPPLPPGYDGERQLAELAALVACDTSPSSRPRRASEQEGLA
jgi:hypothetical protein